VLARRTDSRKTAVLMREQAVAGKLAKSRHPPFPLSREGKGTEGDGEKTNGDCRAAENASVSSDRSARDDSRFEVNGKATVAAEDLRKLGSNPVVPI
jgi:hypothetical protein